MVSYYIRLDKNNQMEAFAFNRYKEAEIISNSQIDIYDSLYAFLKTGFIVKVKANRMYFKKQNNETVCLVDYDRILAKNELSEIGTIIKKNIMENGFINLDLLPKTTRKKRKTINVPKIAKKVGLILISGSIAVSALAYLLRDTKKDNTSSFLINDLTYHSANPVIKKEDEEIILLDNDDNENYRLVQIADNSELVDSAPDLEKESDKSIRKEIINLDFPDYSDSKKAQNTKENYYELICEIAPQYGLDPNLILGICTQEGVIHKPGINKGGAVGLMQIQASVWLNKDLTETYYRLNPETNEYELHKMGRITLEECNDLRKNIEHGCEIYQICLNNCCYNPTAAFQIYNMGYSTVYKMMEMYAEKTGKTVPEIMNDYNDLGWLEYRKLKGDDGYAERVNSWIDNNDFTVTDVRTNDIINYQFVNDNEINIHR